MKLRALWSDERGLSLVEVVVASALSMIILFAVLSTLDSGTKSERITQARQEALLDLREAMARMTKEIRQATSVSSSSNATMLDIQTYVEGAPHRVVYQITGTPPNARLLRSYDGGTPQVLSDRIVAPQAFCYEFDQPDCLSATPTVNLSAVRVSLEMSPIIFGSGTVTLATDVELRNI